MQDRHGNLLLRLWPEWGRASRLDAAALAAANSNPRAHELLGWLHRNMMYEFKERFLRLYATPDGYDLQVIRDLCRGCDGTGRWHYWHDDGGEWCDRCGGTGTYQWRVITLHRWTLHGHVFHVPGESRRSDRATGICLPRELDTSLAEVARWIKTKEPELEVEAPPARRRGSARKVRVLRGIIQHKPMSARRARLALCWLLLRYGLKGDLRRYAWAWAVITWRCSAGMRASWYWNRLMIAIGRRQELPF